jgi:hypothetical protein
VFTIDGEEKTMTPRNKISDFNSLIGKAFPGSGKRALGEPDGGGSGREGHRKAKRLDLTRPD